MNATPVAANMTLPDDTCEWCGATVKFVTVLPGHARAPIDAEAVGPFDWRGDVVRVPPRKCGGHIDCVTTPERADWEYQRRYRLHKNTCPNADKWTGKKKWARPKPQIIRRSPETAHLTDDQIRELQRIDDVMQNPNRW